MTADGGARPLQERAHTYRARLTIQTKTDTHAGCVSTGVRQLRNSHIVKPGFCCPHMSLFSVGECSPESACVRVSMRACVCVRACKDLL